jgi:hypothetical protein
LVNLTPFFAIESMFGVLTSFDNPCTPISAFPRSSATITTTFGLPAPSAACTIDPPMQTAAAAAHASPITQFRFIAILQ